MASVAFVCFNQASFVEQALQSVLEQETDFDFEVIVADDGSTDGTEEIVRDYQQRYPDRILLLLATENMGKITGSGMINVMRCLDRCRGEFVARLEGDDYWTSPTKLQQQVDLLRAEAQLAFCHSRIAVVDESGEIQRESTYPFDSHTLELNDLYSLTTNPVFTGSLCFRKSCFPQMPDSFVNLRLLDWPLTFALLQKGNGFFVDKVLSHYRVHAGGIWSKKKLFFRSWQKLRAAKAAIRTLKLPECPAQRRFLFELRMMVADGLAQDGRRQRARIMHRSLFSQSPSTFLALSSLELFRRLRRRCSKILRWS